MKYAIRLEELALFLSSIYILYYLQASWWIYLLLLMGPDVSMLGYIGGKKWGAVCYNFCHHKAIGRTILFIGFVWQFHAMQLAGLIIFGHSEIDRIMGYGLKYFNGFQHTHLGIIGNTNKTDY